MLLNTRSQLENWRDGVVVVVVVVGTCESHGLKCQGAQSSHVQRPDKCLFGSLEEREHVLLAWLVPSVLG